MNCSILYQPDTLVYNITQYTVLGCMVSYTVIINILSILTTLNKQILNRSPVSKMMLSSYVGNLLAGFSFYLNEIYYCHEEGIPFIGCKEGLDRYFLFTLGSMSAMLTLVFNSYSTYNNIVRHWWLTSTTKSTALTFITIWLIATSFAIGMLLLHSWFPELIGMIKLKHLQNRVFYMLDNFQRN